MFHKFKSVTLLVVMICFALLTCEIYIRANGMWSNDTYKERTFFYDPHIAGVPFLLKPNIDVRWGGVEIKSNDTGIREKKSSGEIKKDVNKKILIIGDSITFGLGVKQQDTFPNQLEQTLLKLTGEKYEAINGGISGFNVSNEEKLLEYLDDVYTPDIIIWSIIANDYDDSLIVRNNGQVQGGREYAVSTAYSTAVWGYVGNKVDKDDFRNSSDKRWLKSADNKTLSKIDDLLSDSYLYSFVKNRLHPFIFDKVDTFIPPQDSLVFTRLPQQMRGDYTYYYPELAPVFISPFFKRRFNKAIRDGCYYSKQTKTPLVILSFDCFVEKNTYFAQGLVHYEEITKYFGMPYQIFRARYNLGWDPHYDKKGNAIIAKAIANVLLDKKIIKSDPPNRLIPLQSEDNKNYYSNYIEIRNEYIKTIRSWVNFKKHQNIDQIMGGIRPNAIFPLYGKTLFVLLGNIKSNTFRLSAYNPGEQSEKIIVSLSNCNRIIHQKVEIKPGQFDWQWTINNNFPLQDRLFDLSLRCITNCSGVKLTEVGFPVELER